LNHHKAESVPLEYKLFKKINDTDDQSFHYWNPIAKDYQHVKIAHLFRSIYKNVVCEEDDYGTERCTTPSTELYTLISLRSALIIFWFTYLGYGLFLAVFKYCTSADFQKANHGKRLQHILECLTIPESYSDWDNDPTLDVAGHHKKWRTVLVEMVWMVFMQFTTNFILLIPLIVTGSNVIARHHLLEGAIGTFPEEDEAYWRVTTLMWALPLTVTLGGLFDFSLVVVYMKYAHPWRGILITEDKLEAEDKLSQTDDQSERVAQPDTGFRCLKTTNL